MGISRCRVSYLDPEGLDHAVEVEAESLYEAVALAVAEFRQGEIISAAPGPMTEFCVTVPKTHRAPDTLQQGARVGTAVDERGTCWGHCSGARTEAAWGYLISNLGFWCPDATS